MKSACGCWRRAGKGGKGLSGGVASVPAGAETGRLQHRPHRGCNPADSALHCGRYVRAIPPMLKTLSGGMENRDAAYVRRGGAAVNENDV